MGPVRGHEVRSTQREYSSKPVRNFTKNVPKIVDLSLRKPPNILDEWDGYPKIFKVSRALEISRQYICSFEQLFYRKKSLGAPDPSAGFTHIIGIWRY